LIIFFALASRILWASSSPFFVPDSILFLISEATKSVRFLSRVLMAAMRTNMEDSARP